MQENVELPTCVKAWKSGSLSGVKSAISFLVNDRTSLRVENRSCRCGLALYEDFRCLDSWSQIGAGDEDLWLWREDPDGYVDIGKSLARGIAEQQLLMNACKSVEFGICVG
jgi:hypothetical protein